MCKPVVGQVNEQGVHANLLAGLGLTSVLQCCCSMDFRRRIALQQQDEGLEAPQAVPLGSRHGGDDSSQQAVCHVLAVGSQEVDPVFTDVGHQLVCLLLHGLVSLLHVCNDWCYARYNDIIRTYKYYPVC